LLNTKSVAYRNRYGNK